MRKLMIGFILFVTAGIVATCMITADERPDTDKFKEGMTFARFDTYTDPDFGYTFEYPSFFTKDEIDDYGCGHVQFAYHGYTDIVLECNVVAEDKYHRKKSDFIDKGTVDDIEGYCYYSHFIRHNHCWYILSLYYPKEFSEAVKQIRYKVRTWNTVFNGRDAVFQKVSKEIGGTK